MLSWESQTFVEQQDVRKHACNDFQGFRDDDHASRFLPTNGKMDQHMGQPYTMDITTLKRVSPEEAMQMHKVR